MTKRESPAGAQQPAGLSRVASTVTPTPSLLSILGRAAAALRAVAHLLPIPRPLLAPLEWPTAALAGSRGEPVLGPGFAWLPCHLDYANRHPEPPCVSVRTQTGPLAQ